jgi:predicted peptidase
MQTGEHLSTVIQKEINLDYLIHVPSSYYSQNETYPLILFLHGSAQRGDDITLVKQAGLPKIIEHNPEFPVYCCFSTVSNHRYMDIAR